MADKINIIFTIANKRGVTDWTCSGQDKSAHSWNKLIQLL